MVGRVVTVFGGTGFLGRRIVSRMARRGFTVRVATRHPERCRSLFGRDSSIEPIGADVNDNRSVMNAVAGAYGVVNAISLYVERRDQTFRSIHVESAARVARRSRVAGVDRVSHISGIGADAASSAPYIRSRGEGEAAVRDAFPSAVLIRPAVMFGRGDAFLGPLCGLLRHMPVFALFGHGHTKLQPAHVEDVAEAVARDFDRPPQAALVYELGGPHVYAYAELIRLLARHVGAEPILVPMPFGIWHALAFCAEMLPSPPITRNQVDLMEVDSMASPDAPGFATLAISPASIEQVLPSLLAEREKETV